MLRARFLLLLAISFLMASAAWANDVGYVDCAAHPDPSTVYGKARQSQDIVGTVACGERFTILLYGFIFSRVQTADNKIGYVFSNLITIDHATVAVSRPAQPQLVASSKAPANAATPAISNAAERTPVAREPKIDASAPPQPAAAQAAPVQPQGAVAQTASAQPAATEITLPASAPAPAAASPQQPAASAPDSGPVVSAQPQPPAVQPAPTPSDVAPAAAPAPAANATTVPDPSVATALSNPPAASQPEPAAAEPAAPQPPPPQPEVAPATMRSSWERPNPTGRRQSLVEVYGGYAFTRFDNGGGTFTNLNGFMGAFGINIKSWIQFIGDSSYNFVTTNGVKTTIYGNHYGARYFYRKLNRWSATPFVEAMIGGTRLATSVSGAGGYSTSDNEISYKIGGGVDIHPYRHVEIRVIDFDYYRTAFGTNLHQNNYWATAGIVLRLFGGRGE
jgi:hypothetical protein